MMIRSPIRFQPEGNLFVLKIFMGVFRGVDVFGRCLLLEMSTPNTPPNHMLINIDKQYTQTTRRPGNRPSRHCDFTFCGFNKKSMALWFHAHFYNALTVGSWKYIVFSNEFCVFVVSKHLFLLTVFLWKFVFRVGFGRPKCHSFVLLLAVSHSLRFFDKALLVKVSNEACWLECQWRHCHIRMYMLLSPHPPTHPPRISVNVWWNA